MEKPTRPARYQAPKSISLLPVKKPMRRPYWDLRIDGIGHQVKNKAEAFDVIRRRYEAVFFTDDQIWAELSNSCGDVLAFPYSYNWDKETDTFTEFRDKHNWHRGDDVLYAFWLADQRKRKSA